MLCFVALSAVSCSDWLDVKPSDRIDEETAFSNLAGFRQALNGIYIELNDDKLYGRTLTSEFIEVMGQRYAITGSENVYNYLAEYDYTRSSALAGRIQSIWEKAYNLIANCNLLLKNCELQRGKALTEDYYQLIRGEALALRAFLHFDLFRLFGPVYSDHTELITIPYYEAFSFQVAESLTAENFMIKVIDDLLEAEKALVDDPVIANGPDGDQTVTFLSLRNLRLNYYAVQAMLARAYLYIGNPDGLALDYALKVIGIHERHFPWVDPMVLQGDTPDRMFSSEVLFGLQNVNRSSIFSALFDGSYLKAGSLLAPEDQILDYVFNYEKTDYRYDNWFGTAVELGGFTYRNFIKYKDSGEALQMQLIPLIRISEMYLIAAEISPTTQEGVEFYNTLRRSRGVAGKYYYNYKSWMEDEWRMEFYGEGQLFYYYKRRNLSSFMANKEWNYTSMTDSKYKLPVPDAETKYN